MGMVKMIESMAVEMGMVMGIVRMIQVGVVLIQQLLLQIRALWDACQRGQLETLILIILSSNSNSNNITNHH